MNSSDQLQQRINFFESSARAKDEIAKSESDRLKLEIELNRLINSDQSVSKAKAIKLKAYYTKLCDDEAKSLRRNQQLLNDLQRIDSQFQQLETKLERLSNLKKECEVYLRTSYPRWTDENQIGKSQLTNQSYQNQGPDLITQNLNRLNELNQKKLNEFYKEDLSGNKLKLDPTKQETSQSSSNYNLANILINSAASPGSQIVSSINQDNINRGVNIISPNENFNIAAASSNSNQILNKPSNLQLKDNQHSIQQQSSVLENLILKPSISGFNENLKDVDTKMNKNDQNIQEEPNHYIKQLIASQLPPQSSNNVGIGNEAPKTSTQVNFGATEINLLKEYEKEIQRRDTNMNEFTLGNSGSSTIIGAALVGSSIDVQNPLVEKPKEPYIKPNLPKQIDQDLQSPTSDAFERKPQLNNWSSTPIARRSEEKSTSIQQNLDKNLNQNDASEDETSEFKRQSSLRQELDLAGLYRLLDYIETELKHTIHPEKYYRQVEPHYKNKLEIIKLAREGKSLDEQDSGSISMVVQDQLPVVIRKYTSNSCLFSSDLLGLSVADINENIVRNSLREVKDKELWDRLLKHWISLRRMAFMDSNSISLAFAPSLLGQNSYGIEKAAKFLEKIINLATSQLDPLSESKSLTETSINKELLLASSSKLKETSAYQQFILSSTQNSNKSKRNESESDEDENDEIDALVAPKSILSTNSSGRAMPLPNLGGSLIKSPRNNLEGDFDFSLSTSESQKKSGVKQLNSLRSSKDKKIPLHLRDFEDSEDDTESQSNDIKGTMKSQKSDVDFDFYN